ncbi:hypothetical protein F7D20_08935, partial [Prevotella copri]|nr:hypothetical protein [Segatella copri]
FTLHLYRIKHSVIPNWGNPYDIHIPLVFMGWHIQHGATTQPHYMTDIAATVSALLHIQAPNGCIGTPIF